MWRRMPGPATCRPSHRPKLQINFVWLKIRQLVRRRSVAGDGRSVDLLLSRTVLLAPRQRVALATQRDSSCQGPWRPQPHGHTAAPSDAVQHTRQRTAWPRRCNRWPGGAPQHALHACVYSINQSTSQPTNQPLGYEKPPLGAPLGRGVLVGQEGLKHLAPAQPAGRPWRNRGGERQQDVTPTWPLLACHVGLASPGCRHRRWAVAGETQGHSWLHPPPAAARLPAAPPACLRLPALCCLHTCSPAPSQRTCWRQHARKQTTQPRRPGMLLLLLYQQYPHRSRMRSFSSWLYSTFSAVSMRARSQLQRSLSGMCMYCSMLGGAGGRGGRV